jgi:hypothetical protein
MGGIVVSGGGCPYCRVVELHPWMDATHGGASLLLGVEHCDTSVFRFLNIRCKHCDNATTTSTSNRISTVTLLRTLSSATISPLHTSIKTPLHPAPSPLPSPQFPQAETSNLHQTTNMHTHIQFACCFIPPQQVGWSPSETQLKFITSKWMVHTLSPHSYIYGPLPSSHVGGTTRPSLRRSLDSLLHTSVCPSAWHT